MYLPCYIRACVYRTDRDTCSLAYKRRDTRCPHHARVLVMPERSGADYLMLPQQEQQGMITYRLEYVSCGKCKRCKEQGPAHGPYWYAYWKEGRRTRSRYIGKAAPTVHGISTPTADSDNS